ncbi:MAG: dephospho-CoA kinase [Oscillospiraceae bacterium]
MISKRILVGLTGQTGAGKTVVSRYLQQKGYQVINADAVAREVVAKGSQCLLDLVLAFGVDILQADGTLNRRKLGDIVFTDPEKRKTLNRITFPYIQEEIFSRVEQLQQQGADIVFLDAPTLFESGTHKRCDQIVSVIAPPEIRLERILQRDDITQEQGKARMSAQHPDEFYTTRSHHVLVNDSSLPDLFAQVDEMLAELQKLITGEGA